MLKLPHELYVTLENKNTADEFISVASSPDDFAVFGETVTVMLYRRIGAVTIKTTVQTTKPKGA